MKPKIFLFGLPTLIEDTLNITIYKEVTVPSNSRIIVKDNIINDNSGMLIIELDEDISIDESLYISIISTEAIEDNYTTTFMGGDITYVPRFILETNSNTPQTNTDQYYDELFKNGINKQSQYISSKKINIEPLWKTYYESSKIDYLERFHRLWIGLNAYASYHSQETQDGKKIFDLVNTQSIKNKFYASIKFNKYTEVSNQLLQLQSATGVDTSSDILKLDITNSNPIIDFMEQCKLNYETIRVSEKLVNDFIFLDTTDGINIFNTLYRKYHAYIASPRGMANVSDFSEIFDDIKSPESIQQIGRLIFRDHLKSDISGSLYAMNDFYESTTLNNLYSGIPNQTAFEQVDSLFFRYLYLLYKFRSAYFHGDFILNHENNELAKSAYLSLLEIYPET